VKAIVHDGYGSPDILRLEEIPKPTPGDADVLVKIRASSVNAVDLEYLSGVPYMTRIASGLLKPKSNVPGLDVAGYVESVGKSVTRFRPGDEVFGDMTEHGFGAFAEYVCAPESAFALKPAKLTFEEAACVPQAGILAVQGLRGGGQIHPGERILINGAGGNVGPFALQIAKSHGAHVTGVDSATKLEMLRSIGADEVIDYAQEDFTKTGERYDLILDVAAYHALSDSRRALNPTGVYVMVGGPTARFLQVFLLWPWNAVKGSRKMRIPMWKPFREDDVVYLKELIEAGTIAPVIDRTYTLSEVPEALQHQKEGLVRGKVVITV